MTVRREQFANLLDPKQFTYVLNWGLHSSYEIVDGCIYGEGNSGVLYQPLKDSDLFLSFARLAARGEPSEESILRWVSRYGLLRRGDESHGLNQEPMAVEEFREEARCAHQLLALYTEIQERDYAGIRARFAGEGEHRYSKLHRNVVDQHFAIFQEDQESRRRFEATSEYEAYFDRGVVALESLVGQLVSNVRLRPRSYISELRWVRHKPYKPDLMLDCPDLRSAIYLQFCLMMVDNRPMRRCQNPHCQAPFLVNRKDKRYCKPGCRSSGRNYR